jgi:hypothetical protein
MWQSQTFDPASLLAAPASRRFSHDVHRSPQRRLRLTSSRTSQLRAVSPARSRSDQAATRARLIGRGSAWRLKSSRTSPRSRWCPLRDREAIKRGLAAGGRRSTISRNPGTDARIHVTRSIGRTGVPVRSRSGDLPPQKAKHDLSDPGTNAGFTSLVTSCAWRLKSSRTSPRSRWCPREIAKRSSGDSPPEEGEARSLGIRARMPGFTSLVYSI